MSHERIDELDIKILEILQRNGRTKRNVLAEVVGLSIPSVSDRLRKLEERGVIKGYVALIDPNSLGYDIEAFVIVNMDSSKHYVQFLDHAAAADEILECHAITGEGTYMLKVRTHSTSTLEKLLSRIQLWSGVLSTKTSVVLSSPKETMHLKVEKSLLKK
jgi:Lrp/AsnC family leucine-responsive transcriptional regulator